MKVLFCGLGGIGQRHLRNLRQIIGSDLQVDAYRVRGNSIKLKDDLTVDRGGDLESAYQITTYQDLTTALEQSPRAVFICNPNSYHVPIALECVRAGIPVFMEKPLASDLEGVATLLKEVQKQNLLFYVGYNFRFHPGLQRLKKLLDIGFFGQLLSARFEIGEYLPNWHRYEDYRKMYASREDQGGGVILSQIHEMDLIYWFFGLPSSIITYGGHLSRLEIDVEDTASSLMQCNSETGSFPVFLHQDYLQRPPVRMIKVVGDAGYAEINLINNHMHVFDAEGQLVEHNEFKDFARNDMFLDQTRHFLECLGDKETPVVSLGDGIESLRLALAARQSLQENRVIMLEEIKVHG